MASGVSLVAFWIYFLKGKRLQKSTGILEIIFVRENGQKPRQPPHVLSCHVTSDKLVSLPSSFGHPLTMHASGDRSI
jgi:hypothetical protein